AQYRAVSNSNSFQLGIGFTDIGLLVNGGFSRAFSTNIRGTFAGSFSTANYNDIQYYGIYMDGIIGYTMFSPRGSKFMVNAQGGISFVYDKISEFQRSDDSPVKSSLNTGIIGGLEAEFIMNKLVSVFISSNLRYYIKDDFGRVRNHSLIGFRYIIR
ncbi:MAG: hypothetical protein RJQ14_09475, partial [Marinoscillum sp.]